MKNIPLNLKFAVTAFFLLLVSVPALAETKDTATVLQVSGKAEYKEAGATEWKDLGIGTVMTEGDAVKTGPGAEITIELAGAAKTAEIVVRESSKFVFHTFQHDEASAIDTTLLDVSLGAILVKAEKLAGESKFEVKTPTSIVGIRGTTFEVTVDK